MRTSPSLCLVVALFLAGCLDWSTASPSTDAGMEDATTDAQDGDSAGDDGDSGMGDGDSGQAPSCPAQDEACAGKCGTVSVEGCPNYECEACDVNNVCTPDATCASVDAECGTFHDGCEMVTCENQCPDLPCVELRCCEPEDVAKTCAGSCGGKVTNNCGQEIDCENPCGPSSNGCEPSAPPVAALCYCPHADQGPTCEQTQFVLDRPTDFAFDAQTGFGYVLDNGRDAVLRVDHKTGARMVLSDDDDDGVPRGAGPGFHLFESIVLDAQNQRLFVSDRDRDAILEVDVNTGNRKVVSDADHEGFVRGHGYALEGPGGMALDANRGRLFVTSGLGELIAVTLGSDSSSVSYGDRDMVSTAGVRSTVVGTGPRLDSPNGVALDLAHDRAYVFTSASIMSVELATGNRAVVSRGVAFSAQDPLRGTGPAYSTAYSGGLVHLPSGRAFVFDQSRQALFAVDLTSGERTIISGKGENGSLVGDGPMAMGIAYIQFDADERYVLALDQNAKGVLRIDTTTGDRSVVYDSAVGQGPGVAPLCLALHPTEHAAIVGERLKGFFEVDLATGARVQVVDGMSNMTGATVDASSGTTAYALDQVLGVLRIDLATGERTLVSDNANPAHNTIPLNANAFKLVHDAARDRLVILNFVSNDVVAVDLTTGLRRVLSGSARGTGPQFLTPLSLALDGSRNRIYVVDQAYHGALSVNLQTGDRVLVTGKNRDGTLVGDGPLPYPIGLALDAEAGVLYLGGSALSGLLRVDLSTGNRTVVSLFSTVPGSSRGEGIEAHGANSMALDKGAGFLYGAGGPGVLVRWDIATGDRRLVSKAGF